jgi:predicted metal-dependent phosphoesterase TrpH
MKSADLHMHSTFSDGDWTPEKLVKSARRVGLTAIALTDHDSVDGLQQAVTFGQQHGLEVIPGVEISAFDGGVDLHILGYGFDPDHAELRAMLLRSQKARTTRAARMVEKLAQLGAPLRLEDVLAKAEEGVVGRPHVAQALLDAGHVRSVREAFEVYLGDGKPACVDKIRVTAQDAIQLLHRAGGVAVAAHPGTYGGITYLESLLQDGIDGVEVLHSLHDSISVGRLEDFARAHDLVMTGGSDFHGPRMGLAEVGSVKIPYEWVELLRERAQNLRERGNGRDHGGTIEANPR